jgi:hypothetical protein
LRQQFMAVIGTVQGDAAGFKVKLRQGDFASKAAHPCATRDGLDINHQALPTKAGQAVAGGKAQHHRCNTRCAFFGFNLQLTLDPVDRSTPPTSTRTSQPSAGSDTGSTARLIGVESDPVGSVETVSVMGTDIGPHWAGAYRHCWRSLY